MAYFTTLGRADTTTLACGVGWEIVMEHEAFTIFTGQGIDDLFVTTCAQSGYNQSLRFAPGE